MAAPLSSILLILLALCGCSAVFCEGTPASADWTVVPHRDLSALLLEDIPDDEPIGVLYQVPCRPRVPDGRRDLFELRTFGDLELAVGAGGCDREALEASTLARLRRETVDLDGRRLFVLSQGVGGCVDEVNLRAVYREPGPGLVFEIVKVDRSAAPTPALACELDRGRVDILVAVDEDSEEPGRVEVTSIDAEVCLSTG